MKLGTKKMDSVEKNKNIESMQKKIRDEFNINKILYVRDNLDPNGYFSLETFDISFNREYLKEVLSILENGMNLFYKFKAEGMLNISTDYLYEHEAGRILSEAGQVVSHEMFHLYQFLTIPTLIEYSYFQREISRSKWIILYSVVPKGFIYKKGEEIINKRSLSFYGKSTFNEEIESTYKYYHRIIKNIGNECQITGLSIIHLIEGSAVAFQNLINKDSKSKIMQGLERNEIYNLAYRKFIKKSGISTDETDAIGIARLVFLFVAYLSMLCDEERADKIIDMFMALSNMSIKYFNKAKAIGSPFSKKFYNHPDYRNAHQFKYLPSFGIKEAVNEITDEDKLTLYVGLCDLVDDILDDIKLIDPNHLNSITIRDNKLKAIQNYIQETFPNSRNIYFIPFLICEYLQGIKFSTLYNAIGNIEYEGWIDGFIMTVDADTYFINDLEKVENILLGEELFFCSKKHGKIRNTDTITNCTEPDSFNMRYSVGPSEKKLSDFIEVL